MRDRPRLLGALALSFGLAGCARHPAVTVEQLYAAETPEAPDPQSSRHVFAPRCAALPPARYPADVPEGERPERVDVRVDLVIDEHGRARDARGTVLNDVENARPFVEAAELAAYLMSCEPALRSPRADSDETAPVPIAYRSAVVFRFYRDERRVEVEAQE